MMKNRNARSRLGFSADSRVRIPDNGTALSVTVEEINQLAAEGKRPTASAVIELRTKRSQQGAPAHR